MDKTVFGISVLVGATVGRQYFSAFDSAEQRANKLGSALEQTNRKLASAREVAKYKSTLESLRIKQQALGGTSERLAIGIEEVEKRYKEAKREAKAYGIQIGDLVNEQKKLTIQSKVFESKISHLDKAQLHKERLLGLRTTMLSIVGMAYGASRMFSSAMNLEDSEVRLGTVLNSATPEDDLQ